MFPFQTGGESAPGPNLPRRISLADETARAMRERILRGAWRGHLPGERELCSLLAVSRPTLQAAMEVLQREGLVETEARKRRRILAPPASAPREFEGVLAVLAPYSLAEVPPSSLLVVDELRARLSNAGVRLEWLTQPGCFTGRPERVLEAITARTKSAAWLIIGSNEPMQRWFLRRRLPCLVFGSSFPGVSLPSLDYDHRATCRHAGGVLRAKGHRRVAIVLPDSASAGDAESVLGFREAFREGDPDGRISVILHDGTPAHVCTLLNRALRSFRPPTALVVARPNHVLTVVTHLLERGLRLPEDIAIISRDDEIMLRHVTPVVARYEMNPGHLSRRVARAALRLLDTHSLPPEVVLLIPNFVPGETV